MAVEVSSAEVGGRRERHYPVRSGWRETMIQGAGKPTKTAGELKAMVEQQAAGWPECADMLGAAIVQPIGESWDVSLIGQGRTLVKVNPCWNRLGPFVRALQDRYDLQP